MAKKKKLNAKQKREQAKEEKMKKIKGESKKPQIKPEVKKSKPSIVNTDLEINVSDKELETSIDCTEYKPIGDYNKYLSYEELEELKKYYHARTRSGEMFRNVPKHDKKEVPEFLREKKLSGKRMLAARKLNELIMLKYSISEIADIFLYNNFEDLNELIDSKREMIVKARQVYPDFQKNAEQKMGKENYKKYMVQQGKIDKLIKYLDDGDFLFSKNPVALEDEVSSVVDTFEFSEACKIEGEFVSSEIDTLMSKIESIESKQELADLVNEAERLREELRTKISACEIMEDLMENKKSKQRGR